MAMRNDQPIIPTDDTVRQREVKLQAIAPLADHIAALALQLDASEPGSFGETMHRVNSTGTLEKALLDRVFGALRTGDEFLDEGISVEAEQEAGYLLGVAVGRRLAGGGL